MLYLAVDDMNRGVIDTSDGFELSESVLASIILEAEDASSLSPLEEEFVSLESTHSLSRGRSPLSPSASKIFNH